MAVSQFFIPLFCLVVISMGAPEISELWIKFNLEETFSVYEIKDLTRRLNTSDIRFFTVDFEHEIMTVG